MKGPYFAESLTFAGTTIDITEKTRNLGVMDNNVTFNSRVNEICRKATLAIRSIGSHSEISRMTSLKC